MNAKNKRQLVLPILFICILAAVYAIYRAVYLDRFEKSEILNKIANENNKSLPYIENGVRVDKEFATSGLFGPVTYTVRGTLLSWTPDSIVNKDRMMYESKQKAIILACNDRFNLQLMGAGIRIGTVYSRTDQNDSYRVTVGIEDCR